MKTWLMWILLLPAMMMGQKLLPSPFPIGAGGGGGGGGTAVAPYFTTVTAQTSVSIGAGVHNQGVLAVAYCFDNSTPRIAVSCDQNYTRDSSGNLVFTFSPAFTGLIEVGSGGGSSAGSPTNYQTSTAFTGVGPTAFTPTHTLDVFDNTASTGNTSFFIKSGAGQAANLFTSQYSSSVNDLLGINTNGTFYGTSNALGFRYQLVVSDASLRLASDGYIPFNSTANLAGGALDTSISRCTAGVICFGTGAQGSSAGSSKAAAYLTNTNCSNAASPAVCGSAAAGAVAIPTGGTSVTLTVNTTAITANSRITLLSDDSLTIAATTCNSTLATLAGGLAVTARTPGTSFTITYNGTIATNPLCVSYSIIN